MKESPILMTTESVKAILDGRKTQTRRVIKPQPIEWQISQDILGLRWKDENLGSLSRDHRGSIAENYLTTLCPYGQVGDRLWVRETWAVHEYYDGRKPSDIPEGVTIECKITPDAVETDGNGHRKIREGERGKWRPSIFMPRWASRIIREITEVGAERVQEITAEDCVEEGIISGVNVGGGTMEEEIIYEMDMIDRFHKLWDFINGKPKPHLVKGEIAFYESYPWEDIRETRTYRGKPWHVHGNPWVWPMSFKRIGDA